MSDESGEPRIPLRAQSAFTLIELLVSIFIISALIAILVPSLSAARSRGQRTACSSNLRQVGVAMRSYLDASNDIYPYVSFMPSMGPGAIDGDVPIYLADVLSPHGGGDPKVFRCPGDFGGIERPDPNIGKSYFESERSSFVFRVPPERPSLQGRTLQEVIRRVADFTGRHWQESEIWIVRDYDNFHGEAGKPGARRYLYNDGRVTDFEN